MAPDLLHAPRRHVQPLLLSAITVTLCACGAGSAGSSSGSPARVGGQALPDILLFSATDSAGTEPWVLNGVSGETARLEDINGAGGDSDPEGFTRIGDVVIFTARQAATGRELWVTDGRPGGSTTQVRDIFAGPDDGVDPGQPFPVLDGYAYFRATNPSFGGAEVWRTNGTDAGTERVADIRIGPEGSNPHGFTVFDGHVFFAADNGEHGMELWKIDATGRGAERVLDINEGEGSSTPADFTVTDGDLYFTAEGEPGERELWRLLNADANPRQVTVINDNPGTGAGIRHLTAYGDGVAFAATDGDNGFELWLSEGDDSSTRMLEDIAPDSDDGVPPDSTPFVHDGRLYFAARDDPDESFRLWVSETPPGTDPHPAGSAGSTVPAVAGQPGSFAALDGFIYFAGETDGAGVELWRTDTRGTEQHLVQDIAPGMADSAPMDLTVFQGRLYFSAEQGGSRQLWRTAGTGVERVTNITGAGSADVRHLAAFD